jgi:hypothetical protein
MGLVIHSRELILIGSSWFGYFSFLENGIIDENAVNIGPAIARAYSLLHIGWLIAKHSTKLIINAIFLTSLSNKFGIFFGVLSKGAIMRKNAHELNPIRVGLGVFSNRVSHSLRQVTHVHNTRGSILG